MSLEANNPDDGIGLSMDDAASRLFASPDENPGEDSSVEAVEPETTDEHAEPVEVDDGVSNEAQDVQDDVQEESAQPEFVEIDGEKINLEDIRNDRMRWSDYTRKTQELADQRKQFLAEREQVFNDYKTRVEQAMQIASAFLPPPPDPSLVETDPIEYMQRRTEYEQQLSKVQQLQAQHQQITKQQQAQQQQQMQQYLVQQREALLSAIPEFKDASTVQKFQAELMDDKVGVKAYGFTPEELGQVYDHRLLLMARDAMAYRKLQAGKDKVTKSVAKAPPMVKPGVRQSTADAKAEAAKLAKAKVKRTGSIDDAVEYLLRGK